MSLYTHNKTGHLYRLIGSAVDCTNSLGGRAPVAVYRRIDDPNSLFVRDHNEFLEKFTKRVEYTQAPKEVKPFAWAIQGSSRMWLEGEFSEADAKAEAARCGGTCTAFPLFKELK